MLDDVIIRGNPNPDSPRSGVAVEVWEDECDALVACIEREIEAIQREQGPAAEFDMPIGLPELRDLRDRMERASEAANERRITYRSERQLGPPTTTGREPDTEEQRDETLKRWREADERAAADGDD